MMMKRKCSFFENKILAAVGILYTGKEETYIRICREECLLPSGRHRNRICLCSLKTSPLYIVLWIVWTPWGRLICSSVLPFIELSGRLSDWQYGLRRIHSTANMTVIFLDLAREAICVCNFCAVVMSNRSNTFNLTNRDWIEGYLSQGRLNISCRTACISCLSWEKNWVIVCLRRSKRASKQISYLRYD